MSDDKTPESSEPFATESRVRIPRPEMIRPENAVSEQPPKDYVELEALLNSGNESIEGTTLSGARSDTDTLEASTSQALPASRTTEPPPEEPFALLYSAVTPSASMNATKHTNPSAVQAPSTPSVSDNAVPLEEQSYAEPPHANGEGVPDGEPDSNNGLPEAARELGASTESEETAPLEGFAAVESNVGPVSHPTRAFVGERPASAHLNERGALDEWLARAEWLEQEALAKKDNESRARGLLVASEVWALAGNTTQARQVAEQAAKLGLALGGRQARQLAMRDRDYKTASNALSSEIHAAPTPAAQAHAGFLRAEIARLIDDDEATSARTLDQAARIAPADVRALLFKLIKQLGINGRPPNLKWPKSSELQPLVAGMLNLSSLRGDLRQQSSESVSSDPVLTFVQAKRALGNADRKKAAEAVLRLSSTPGFERASRWLGAALYAPMAPTRPLAIELLTELLELQPGRLVRRALAARAVEGRDKLAAERALAPTEPLEQAISGLEDLAFTAADRIAIVTLTEASGESLVPWLRLAQESPELRPLVWAVSVALDIELEAEPCADRDGALKLKFALVLARGKLEALSSILGRFKTAFPHSPLAALLELEQALEDGELNKLTGALINWPEPDGSRQKIRPQAHYAAAVLYERAGQEMLATAHFQSALESEVFREAAARPLLLNMADNRKRELIVSIAEGSTDSVRKALLLLEASLLTDEYAEQHLDAAHAAAPELPFAEHLGLERALIGHDTELASHWLELARQRAETEYERALLLVRQALLSSDPEQAASLLDAALEGCPDGISIADLMDQLALKDMLRRAERRQRIAQRLEPGPIKCQRLLEAAWYFEQAGQCKEAAEAAHTALSERPSRLAELLFERAATTPAQVQNLRAKLRTRADTLADAASAEAYLSLASLERRVAARESEVGWLRKAVGTDPSSLAALTQLEYLALQGDLTTDLLSVEPHLLARLPDDDGASHALMATRLAKVHLSWSDAYEPLKAVPVSSSTPLFMLREIQAHARRAGDDARLYSVLVALRSQAQHALDKATLSLRAGEAAIRLQRDGDALRQIEEAAKHTPQHVLVQSQRARLLAERGDHAQAAALYEQLAQLSRVPAHRSEAWKLASQLWLNEASDEERGLAAMEHAAALNPACADMFQKLRRHYEQTGQLDKLEQLVRRRIEHVEGRDEQAELQVLLSRISVKSGDRQVAKDTLKRILSNYPDHPEALDQLAQLASEDGEHRSAEEAYLQLSRLNPDPGIQADVYRKLAVLYTGPLANPERAERCYQEVLRRVPGDAAAIRGLTPLYSRLGQEQKAVDLIQNRIDQTIDETEERRLKLELARTYEQVLDNANRANATLLDALEKWPLDVDVVQAAAQFFARTGRMTSLVELGRATTELIQSRLSRDAIELEHLQVVATLADSQNDEHRQLLALSAAGTLSGDDERFPAAEERAMARTLDDLLAPSPVSGALRTLLMQSRGLLDRAIVPDFEELAATACEDTRVLAVFERTAKQIGVPTPELLVSHQNPLACIVSAHSPTSIIVGHRLIERASDEMLEFYAWHNLKLLQARAGVIARLQGEELKTAIYAFLGCFVETVPTSSNPEALETLRARMKQLASSEAEDDVPVLALEVLQQLQHVEDLGLAFRKWANRSALLATGCLQGALAALARLNGREELPSDSNARLEFVRALPEARDLIVSIVSPNFAVAYRRSR